MKNLFNILLLKSAVRIDQFDQTADHFTDGYGIALIQILSEAVISIQHVAVLLFTQFTQELSQIICDETIVIREVLRTELWDLPSRDVAVHTGKERGICSRFRRERIEKAISKRLSVCESHKSSVSFWSILFACDKVDFL